MTSGAQHLHESVVSEACADPFPDDQRTLEGGIDYERWTPGIERAPREVFADKLDFLVDTHSGSNCQSPECSDA